MSCLQFQIFNFSLIMSCLQFRIFNSLFFQYNTVHRYWNCHVGLWVRYSRSFPHIAMSNVFDIWLQFQIQDTLAIFACISLGVDMCCMLLAQTSGNVGVLKVCVPRQFSFWSQCSAVPYGVLLVYLFLESMILKNGLIPCCFRKFFFSL